MRWDRPDYRHQAPKPSPVAEKLVPERDGHAMKGGWIEAVKPDATEPPTVRITTRR